MYATKRAKTCPSRVPSSSCTSRAPNAHPWLCLTPLLRRIPTRTLSYPRVLHHRSSKSKRVHGKSRSDFASRRAHDVTHSPDVPVLTWPILQPRPPPCAALDWHRLPLRASQCLRICVLLATRLQIVHLALPSFVGVPPGAGEVRSVAVPYLTSLDASPGPAAALTAGRLVEREKLGFASKLYDVLRLAALFDVLESEPKELMLVLAPDVDARTRRRLLGVLAKTGEGPEVLELGLEGKSDEVALQVLYKPVDTWPLDVRSLHTLYLGAVWPTANESEEGPSRPEVLTRPFEESALPCHCEAWSPRRSLVRN